jgi:hypothetical protein
LLALAPSAGTLSPTFDTNGLNYALQVSLFDEQVQLTPAAPEGAQITINGQALTPGDTWTSPTLALGDNTLEIDVLRGGEVENVYALTIVRGEPQVYLKASDTAAGARFGFGVAISGDGSTLAVGAPITNEVYVFTNGSGGWSQEARLKQPESGQFGTVLAMSANGDTLAIGAYGDASGDRGVGADESDDSAPNAGAVHVFVRNNTQWTREAYIKASNADANDEFGVSVALSDSGDELAVGALGEASANRGVGAAQNDNTAATAGAAYVFKRDTGAWTQSAYIKASNAEANDAFGSDVSLSADGTTLAVGASGEASGDSGIGADPDDNTALYSGAAYVFEEKNGTWQESVYIKASDSPRTASFGQAIALSKDGKSLVVGSGGSAYLFRRDSGGWSEAVVLEFSDQSGYDGFGVGVSISDAGDWVAIGAPDESGKGGPDANPEDDSVPGSGAAYVYRCALVSCTLARYVKALNAGTDDHFGYSLALSSDARTLVVGAWEEDGSGVGSDANPNTNDSDGAGAAYVVR